MITPALRARLEEALGDRVRFDVPLSRHTSLRVGGPAGAVASPHSREDLAHLLALCHAQRIPRVVIGSGFNVLVSDDGFPGVVIRLNGWRRLEERPGAALRAEAGVSHSQITNFCIERGLAGLEFACGIPGNVGGWLAMNAGVPAREMGDVVREIEVMSPTGARIRHLRRDELRFEYRALRGLAPGSLILSALFDVGISTRDRVRNEVEHLLAARAASQPLHVPSCG